LVTILGVDPGETTGYALVTCGETMDTLEIVEHGVVVLWHGLEVLILQNNVNVVVAEQFRLYPKLAKVQSFSTMVASRVLGAVEEITDRLCIPLKEQGANVGKNVHVPETIYEIVRKYKTAHEKDALKHAIAYLYGIGVK